jgi:hypothetical protein
LCGNTPHHSPFHANPERFVRKPTQPPATWITPPTTAQINRA